MKQIVLFISIICINCAHTNGKIILSTLDSIATEYKLDDVDELLFSVYLEDDLKINHHQIQQLNAQQRITILGRFFRWLGDFFTPVWGQYREPYHRENGPYMTFQYDEYLDL